MRKPFPFDEFESKWQAYWDENQTYRTANPGDADFDASKPKYYVLDMFPYPSGAGLHVGHPEGYTATDIIARYKRMNGFNVLHPMGWDAFGLPAEQYAIKTGQHPRITTEANTENFRNQLKAIGFSYDWDREINTTDPEYVKWTQWIFLRLYNSYYCEESQKARPISELEEKGLSPEEIDAQRLAFTHEAPVNWSPDLGTVLANEEVDEWKSKGHTVERRPLRQWMLRITKYAQRLIDDLDTLDWPESIKLLQKNWIGKSEGATVTFEIENTGEIEVFTTRPDTLFGATYMVLAPEHPYVTDITTEENREAVEAYKESCVLKSDLERGEMNKDKSGVFTGAYATNPANGEKIPVWIADYVMMGYGTGAIMAVPAHDERDFEFAKKFGIAIQPVVGERGRPARFYQCDQEVTSSKHKLPHWQQDDSAVFVTFRTDDSLPTEVVEKINAQKEAWIKENPTPWDDKQTKEYHQRFSDKVDELLDQSHGKCLLKSPEIRTVIMDALHHFDRERYLLHDAVIMPNHVHVVFSPLEENTIADILHSWKSFTAKEINKITGDEGRFWQPEYYDRLVRGPKHYEKVKSYIAENPEKANLSDGAFSYYNAGGTPALPYSGHGVAVNSDFLNGLDTDAAKAKMIDWLEQNGKGERKINFKLRDWLFSRQRYWGEPFPLLWDKETGQHACVPESDLPVLQPEMEDFKPTGDPRGPLVKATDWINYSDQFERETNTMPQWAGSCWYYLRYADNLNKERFISEEAENYWSGDDAMVDLYVGGTEHAVLHLLYARFWHKVLFDLGLISTKEPFKKLVNQGLILGEDGNKMSKSIGNVVNPDDIIAEYGADSLRLYEMFMGPLEQVKPWQTNGVDGVSRFLAKVWRLACEQNQEGEWTLKTNLQTDASSDKALLKALHQTIKKVGEDIENLAFNTAISQMMVCLKAFQDIEKKDGLPVPEFTTFLQLLNPFAPHLTEELNTLLGSDQLLSSLAWPAFDAAKLVEDEKTIIVQVNGKLRARLQVASDISKDALEALALADEGVTAFTEGQTIRKVIVVPGKLVNIVAN